MPKYTVEPGPYGDLHVWFYNAEDDQQPVPLISKDELMRKEGGAQLWETIANLVETGEVAP